MRGRVLLSTAMFLLCAFLAWALLAPSRARADGPFIEGTVDDDDELPARPPVADTSLWSGRTLDSGHAAMAAGVGWPGLFVELLGAPSPHWNLGGRVQINYGSPLMGIASGIGGDVQLPIRWHFWGRGDLDLALALRPGFTFGQGALVGHERSFSNDFGWGARLDAGVLLGAHTSNTTTLAFGLLAGAGLSDVSGAGVETFGGFYASAAIEIAVSEDTLMFVLAEGGYGLARAGTFGTPAIFRLWLGLAYEL